MEIADYLSSLYKSREDFTQNYLGHYTTLSQYLKKKYGGQAEYYRKWITKYNKEIKRVEAILFEEMPKRCFPCDGMLFFFENKR